VPGPLPRFSPSQPRQRHAADDFATEQAICYGASEGTLVIGVEGYAQSLQSSAHACDTGCGTGCGTIGADARLTGKNSRRAVPLTFSTSGRRIYVCPPSLCEQAALAISISEGFLDHPEMRTRRPTLRRSRGFSTRALDIGTVMPSNGACSMARNVMPEIFQGPPLPRLGDLAYTQEGLFGMRRKEQPKRWDELSFARRKFIVPKV
jgi:hypothetical protein